MNNQGTLEPSTLALLIMIARTIVKMDRDSGVMAGQGFKKGPQVETEDWLQGETPLDKTQKEDVRSRLALFLPIGRKTCCRGCRERHLGQSLAMPLLYGRLSFAPHDKF